MGREEQIEEREVLDSIFPDEITGNIYVSVLAASAGALTCLQTFPTQNTG